MNDDLFYVLEREPYITFVATGSDKREARQASCPAIWDRRHTTVVRMHWTGFPGTSSYH